MTIKVWVYKSGLIFWSDSKDSEVHRVSVSPWSKNKKHNLKQVTPLFQRATKIGDTSRKLPESREPRMPRLVGEAPSGKITPLGLSELFSKRLNDPDKWTDEKLAEHYKLNTETLSSVLKYYSDFAVVKKKDFPRPQDDMSFIE